MKYHKINSIFKRDERGRFTNEFSSEIFSELYDNLVWYATEKVNGMNLRIYKTGRIAGRTDNAQIPSFAYPLLEEIRDRLIASDLPESTVLYGELYGNKIQNGGHYIPDGNDFVLFDVMIQDHWQERVDVCNIASQLKLADAPLLCYGQLRDFVMICKNGDYSSSELREGARNEGYVLRPCIELQDRLGNRVITKLKFKDFK